MRAIRMESARNERIHIGAPEQTFGSSMNVPLQITFRHMETSPAMEARIRAMAAKLDRFSTHILRCHVTVEFPHQHHQQGNLFEVKIDITVPDAEIAIQRARPNAQAHQDPYVALRDAFRAARRKLQDYERRHRLETKTHASTGIDIIADSGVDGSQASTIEASG